MIRRRRNYKYAIPRAIKVSKYSNETFGGVFDLTPVSETFPCKYSCSKTIIDVSGSSNVLGTRKVKNFTLNLAVNYFYTRDEGQRVDMGDAIVWAIVFVPQGTSAGSLFANLNIDDVHSLYEPNQNVIMSGLLSPVDGAIQRYSPLSRNLNYGDKILFLALTCTSYNAGVINNSLSLAVNLNFALTFR